MGRSPGSGRLNLPFQRASNLADGDTLAASQTRTQPVTTSQRVLRAGARRMARKHLDLHVEGLQHVPRTGPLMLAARHYHHFYDGVALVASLPRPLHIIVGLDWVERSRDRVLMERICAMAGWPVVLRSANLDRLGDRSAYGDDDPQTYQRAALRQSLATLRGGGALVMFPEGYPVIDPQGVTSERASTPLLPFDPGFLRIVDLTQRDGVSRVPIVPVGFDVGPHSATLTDVQADASDADAAPLALTMRIGAPLWLERGDDLVAVACQIEDIVRGLSGLPAHSADAVNDTPAVSPATRVSTDASAAVSIKVGT